MTMLVRIEAKDFELTVCGLPNQAWFDWLLTTDQPLTAGQRSWREIARQATAENSP